MVMAGCARGRKVGRRRRIFWRRLGLGVAPFTAGQSRAAAAAFLPYGKGRHPAGLKLRGLHGLCGGAHGGGDVAVFR